MGIAAGFGTVVGNAAGPVMSIYLINHGMVKDGVHGNTVLVLPDRQLFKLPVVAGMGMLTAETLRFSLLMVAFLVLGGVGGQAALPDDSPVAFRSVGPCPGHDGRACG